MRTTTRILLLIAVPALVAAAASIVGMLTTPDLPTSLAAHWGVDGTVDRMDGLGSYIAIVAIMVPAFTLAATAFSVAPLRHGATRLYARTVVAISAWLGVFLSLSMYLAVRMQSGVSDPASLPVSSLLVSMLVSAGVALGVAALAVLATPALPQTVGLSANPAAIPLAAGERVYWVQLARSPRAIVALPVVIFVGVAVLFAVVGLPVWTLVVVGIALAAVCTMMSWRVEVDQRGLTVTGLFGFPRFHIPLETIVAAAAIDVKALGQFGGWGVRFGRSGWGVITRSGPAMEVQRTSGSNFVVTVDDAATAAGLLTTLAQRG